jgi:hypothetical protein
MPGGDGTGPLGMGPMTGRALGRCAGFGRGLGGGLGGGFRAQGRGCRRWLWGPAPQETDVLKRQADLLEQQLGGIRDRLAQLETAQAQK